MHCTAGKDIFACPVIDLNYFGNNKTVMAKKSGGKKSKKTSARKSPPKKEYYSVDKFQQTGATERILAEENVPVEKTESAKKEPQKTPEYVKLMILGVLAAILIIIVYKFGVVSETKGLEQKCLDVQNDPMLKYPCKCVPTARADDSADTVDAKSNPLCTCECEIPGVGTRVFEVRASK